MSTPTISKIGPADHGRRMSLEEFIEAEGEEGYLYELARGRVVVMPVANVSHGYIVQELNIQVRGYQQANRERVSYIAGGAECAVLLPGMQSERRPDQAIYLNPPPESDQPWDEWIPDIVVEVVSEGKEAQDRDYREQREEYLAAGVREYWIIDPQKRAMLVLRRKGDTWQEQKVEASGAYRTALLPGFELKLAPVFAAGERPKSERKK